MEISPLAWNWLSVGAFGVAPVAYTWDSPAPLAQRLFLRALEIPKLIIILIVLIKLDFEHLIKKVVLFTGLGDPGPAFQVR